MTVEEQVLDAEVIEEPTVAAPEASTEIVRRERRNEAIVPLPIETTRAAMVAYPETLDALLDASDWQGAPKAPGSFVKKSGWRKVAMRFDLDLVRVGDGVERDPKGQPVHAWAVWRAVAPSGRSVESDGYCSIDEKRFANAKGREKLENDLRATATTRAKNRAISDLVGMGAVSAEEIDSGPATQASPLYGPKVEDTMLRQVRAALGYLLSVESGDEKVTEVLREIAKEAGGDLPHIACAAVCRAARMVKENTAASLGEEPQVGAPSEDEFADAFTQPLGVDHAG